MGWLDSGAEAQAHDDYHKAPHKAEITHELLAGAAAFTAAKAYEEHQKKNGKPVSHAVAKELLAGLVGAFVDREVESKGLDFLDKEKAKHAAKKQTEVILVEEYPGAGA